MELRGSLGLARRGSCEGGDQQHWVVLMSVKMRAGNQCNFIAGFEHGRRGPLCALPLFFQSPMIPKARVVKPDTSHRFFLRWIIILMVGCSRNVLENLLNLIRDLPEKVLFKL